jgi:4-hydroxythreonine-4-phosphate dehydrogenase
MKNINAARVAVTLGDACGIGPEVAIKTLAKYPRLRSRCFLVGDPDVACREIIRNRLSKKVRLTLAGSPGEIGHENFLWMVDRGYAGLAGQAYGKESALAGRAAFFWLVEAARWAINGVAGALVTAPVSKHAVSRTVRGFTGQTEVVARLSGVREPVMMLGGKILRVVPATRHVALSAVPRLLNTGMLARSIITTSRGLAKWLGVHKPRIAVCGLNPHAGEGGLLGREEIAVIIPAVRRSVRAGVRASGPHPADTVFAQALKGRYDAVVAMYHDQALIPIKTVEADDAVNATLGLPFLRTSPAHGTAFDIAGRGVARIGSMKAAIEMAIEGALRRG